jgi:hypothetical protein
MSALFRTSNAAGVETPWLTLDALLDGLEAGLVDADDYLFDRVRQAWQPIRKHAGVVAAWDQRMSFRPPEDRRVLGAVRRPAEGFPSLSPEGVTPVSTPAVSRIAARRAAEARADRVQLAMGFAEVALVVGLVVLLAAGLVLVVRGMLGIGG